MRRPHAVERWRARTRPGRPGPHEDAMRATSDTRDSGPRPGSPLWIYLTAVTVAGAAILALALAGMTPAEVRTLAGSPLWWMLALLVVCGELRPIVTPGKSVADAAAASIT